MRRVPRFIATAGVIALLGMTGFAVGSAITAAEGASTAEMADSADDVGPPSDAVELISFDGSFEGSPHWTGVTYGYSGHQCFDLVAAWNGESVGSFGGCGFTQSAETALSLLAIEPGSTTESALGTAVEAPVILAEGYVAEPGDSGVVYGAVAGIVSCDCMIVARWADGETNSVRAVNGFFLVGREMIANLTAESTDTVPPLPPETVSVELAD